jgi:hypothetical protein
MLLWHFPAANNYNDDTQRGMMHTLSSSLSQPYWVYQPGIAFDSLIRRREQPSQRASAGGSGDLAASIARSPDELRAVATLVESRYAARGYLLSGDDGGSRSGITLIAAESNAIIGTLTLRLDGPHGLAADESYGDAIDPVRHAGGGVCELTRLAITRGADSRPVLSALFGSAYLVARHLHRVTDAFIEVNPRHVAFYRKLFGFVVAAGQRVCPRVMAPAVLLRLEIERLEARLGGIGAVARSVAGGSVPSALPA